MLLTQLEANIKTNILVIADSDVTVFSFHPVKIITTAEGGIAVTNDKYLASKDGAIKKSWHYSRPKANE